MNTNEKKIIKVQKVKKDYIILISIVIFIIIIDQLSKIYVISLGNTTIIPGILNFTIVESRRAAYGIGSNSLIMYIITNIIILSIIFKFITSQNEFIDTNLKVFLTFIFAGGISNVIDIIFRRYTVEFIDFTPVVRVPVFNIANLFVLIGWVGVAAIFAYFTAKEWENNKNRS